MKNTERGAFTHYKLSTSLKATIGLENTYLRINEKALVSRLAHSTEVLKEYREENERLASTVKVLTDLCKVYSSMDTFEEE